MPTAGSVGLLLQEAGDSLPPVLHPEVFVPMTLAVVLFSAVAQALTLKPLLNWPGQG